MNPSRISIRKFQISDADDVLRWGGDERITHYLRWDIINSKEKALTYIETAEPAAAISHSWWRSICLDNRSIGYVSVSQDSEEKCRGQISYALDSEYWGKGIATTALRAAIPVALEELPETVRIQALVEIENIGSQRVLEKVGFMKEGLLRKYGTRPRGGQIRDVLLFSLLRTDPLL